MTWTMPFIYKPGTKYSTLAISCHSRSGGTTFLTSRCLNDIPKISNNHMHSTFLHGVQCQSFQITILYSKRTFWGIQRTFHYSKLVNVGTEQITTFNLGFINSFFKVPRSHIKAPPSLLKGPLVTSVTHPPCLFRLTPWENVNRSTTLIYRMRVTSFMNYS